MCWHARLSTDHHQDSTKPDLSPQPKPRVSGLTDQVESVAMRFDFESANLLFCSLGRQKIRSGCEIRWPWRRRRRKSSLKEEERQVFPTAEHCQCSDAGVPIIIIATIMVVAAAAAVAGLDARSTSEARRWQCTKWETFLLVQLRSCPSLQPRGRRARRCKCTHCARLVSLQIFLLLPLVPAAAAPEEEHQQNERTKSVQCETRSHGERGEERVGEAARARRSESRRRRRRRPSSASEFAAFLAPLERLVVCGGETFWWFVGATTVVAVDVGGGGVVAVRRIC